MRRCALSLAVALMLAILSTVELAGCGDKFLRIGRGSRYQRGYVAVHPATILLFAERGSTASLPMQAIEPILRRAGHRPIFIQDRAALANANRSVKADLILADVGDAGIVFAEQFSGSTPPTFVPLVYKAPPTVLASAQKNYHCVVAAPGDRYEALAEIDHAMELRTRR
jgi:hypothetical protein